MDTEPPMINVNDQTVEYGTTRAFSDLLEVSDNRSDEILIEAISPEMKGVTIKNDKQEIIFDDPGKYEIEFSATDEAENQSTEIVKIEVVDTQKPKITSIKDIVLSDADKTGDYLKNFTAKDEIDGDLTKNVKVDDSDVEYGKVGKYQIKASVADKSNNVCTKSFNVIIKDETPPELTLSQSTFSVQVNASAPNYKSGVKAVDRIDGDVTSSIVVDDSAVNYSTAGTYSVIYKITDRSGNTTTKKATVTVNAPVSVSTSSGTQVMITSTGSCYHNHKCGNGTYYWVSLDEALSRGLRACKKCY